MPNPKTTSIPSLRRSTFTPTLPIPTLSSPLPALTPTGMTFTFASLAPHLAYRVSPAHCRAAHLRGGEWLLLLCDAAGEVLAQGRFYVPRGLGGGEGGLRECVWRVVGGREVVFVVEEGARG